MLQFQTTKASPSVFLALVDIAIGCEVGRVQGLRTEQ